MNEGMNNACSPTGFDIGSVRAQIPAEFDRVVMLLTDVEEMTQVLTARLESVSCWRGEDETYPEQPPLLDLTAPFASDLARVAERLMAVRERLSAQLKSLEL